MAVDGYFGGAGGALARAVAVQAEAKSQTSVEGNSPIFRRPL